MSRRFFVNENASDSEIMMMRSCVKLKRIQIAGADWKRIRVINNALIGDVSQWESANWVDCWSVGVKELSLEGMTEKTSQGCESLQADRRELCRNFFAQNFLHFQAMWKFFRCRSSHEELRALGTLFALLPGCCENILMRGMIVEDVKRASHCFTRFWSAKWFASHRRRRKTLWRHSVTLTQVRILFGATSTSSSDLWEQTKSSPPNFMVIKRLEVLFRHSPTFSH